MVRLPFLENLHMQEPWLEGLAHESFLNFPNVPPHVESTSFQHM